MNTQCSASVWDVWHSHRCHRNGTVHEEGKWWCKQHSPSAEKARREASKARWDAKMNRLSAPDREIERLEAINAELLAVLKEAQKVLHGDICQQYDSCVEACETTRATLAKAEEG